ncbi:MAG: hypothetical protein ABIN89_07695 [Chitinophagaceae bacterium]
MKFFVREAMAKRYARERFFYINLLKHNLDGRYASKQNVMQDACKY